MNRRLESYSTCTEITPNLQLDMCCNGMKLAIIPHSSIPLTCTFSPSHHKDHGAPSKTEENCQSCVTLTVQCQSFEVTRYRRGVVSFRNRCVHTTLQLILFARYYITISSCKIFFLRATFVWISIFMTECLLELSLAIFNGGHR